MIVRFYKMISIIVFSIFNCKNHGTSIVIISLLLLIYSGNPLEGKNRSLLKIESISYAKIDKENDENVTEIINSSFLLCDSTLKLQKGSYWIKLKIKNLSEISNYTINADAVCDEVKGFIPLQNSLITLDQYGDIFKIPSSSPGSSKSISLYIKKGSEKTLYILLKNVVDQTILTSSFLKIEPKTGGANLKELLLIGFEQAFILFSIIIFLFAVVLKNENLYLYFIGFLAMTSIFTLSIHQVFGNYFLKGRYELNYYFHVLYSIISILHYLCLIAVLKSANIKPKLWYIVKYIVLVSVIIQVIIISIAFVNLQIWHKYIPTINSVIDIIILSCIIYQFKRNTHTNRYMILGIIAFYGLDIIRNYLAGFSFTNFFFPVEMGVMVESVFFMIALYDKVKMLFVEKDNLKHDYKVLTEQIEILQTNDNINQANRPNNVTHYYSNNKEETEIRIINNSIQDGFLVQLAKLFPEITPNEMRLCSLIRNGATSKEIAEMTNTTEKSIEVMRSRIRKKMNLTQDISLQSFLKSQ